MKLNIKEKDEEKKAPKAPKVIGETKEIKAENDAPVLAKQKIKHKDWEIKPNTRKTEVFEEKPKEAPKMEPIAAKKTRKEGEYGAKDIQVLKGLEPVRLRPGMYIGSTGLDGLHHLIWEVVDNCWEEGMAG